MVPSTRNWQEVKTVVSFSFVVFKYQLAWFYVANCFYRVVWSVRDILLWVKFINMTTVEGESGLPPSSSTKLSLPEAYIHGAHLVFLDGLGAGLTGNHQ